MIIYSTENCPKCSFLKNIEKYEKYRKDIDFIKQYLKAANAASGSEVDANSNVSSKNIATMAPEIHKKDNIFANRLWMHDRITELYGKELADEYIRQLEDHEIYRHDETLPIGTPYCASITLYPFLVNGMTTICGTSKPPHHLRSYLGGFINLVLRICCRIVPFRSQAADALSCFDVTRDSSSGTL